MQRNWTHFLERQLAALRELQDHQQRWQEHGTWVAWIQARHTHPSVPCVAFPQSGIRVAQLFWNILPVTSLLAHHVLVDTKALLVSPFLGSCLYAPLPNYFVQHYVEELYILFVPISLLVYLHAFGPDSPFMHW